MAVARNWSRMADIVPFRPRKPVVLISFAQGEWSVGCYGAWGHSFNHPIRSFIAIEEAVAFAEHLASMSSRRLVMLVVISLFRS